MRTLCRKSFAIGLLVAFLVTTTGRAVPVKAVGTAIAAGSAAFVATGLAFLAYLSLTGAEISVPAENNIEWLDTIGQKVAQYPSGREIYDYAYSHSIASPFNALEDALDYIMPLSRDLLARLTNDFSDTRIIQGIVSYVENLDVSLVATNGFSYAYSFTSAPSLIRRDTNTTSYSFAQYQQEYNAVIAFFDGPLYDYSITNNGITYHYLLPTYIFNPVRNVLQPNGKFGVQQLVNDQWEWLYQFFVGGSVYPGRGGGLNSVLPFNPDWWMDMGDIYTTTISSSSDVPYFPQEVIYEEATDTYWEMTDVDEDQDYVTDPTWPDVLNPDDELEYPIIPYTQMPLDVYGGGGIPDPQWGFNLRDLLDLVGDLASGLLDITLLKQLLNSVGGISTGDSYIYYDYSDNGTTINNFDYYITNNYGDDYITYKIDVSDADEQMPVDLNTIQLYTQNRYVDQFKQSAIAGGSIIRDLVVFWYDVDPEIVYCLFGACILTLIGAFIGKWGHS